MSSEDSPPQGQQPQEAAVHAAAEEKIVAPPIPPPRDDAITVEELKKFDGMKEGEKIYVAMKGIVFDVSGKRDMYGPGGGYHVFAGKDASAALGRSSLKPTDASDDYSTLDEGEQDVLEDWVKYFKKRYAIVGRVVDGWHAKNRA